jgi:hypothetical protein
MNTRSAFFKLRALPLIFSLAGVFPALLAAANPDTSTRENTGQGNAQLRGPNEISLAPSVGVQEAWVARYNGPGNGFDRSNAIALDSMGNVYVTGPSLGSGSNWDYATIKYNASGQEEWVTRYNGPGNSYDEAKAMRLMLRAISM